MKSQSIFTDYDMSNTGKGRHFGYWLTSLHNDPRDLPWPGDFVDTAWDSKEKEAVIKYLDEQEEIEHWMGYSFCRLCGFRCDGMGAADKSDGTYVWPEGFSHYVREHNVKPPQEFIDHVLGKNKREEYCYSPKDRLCHVFPLPDWAIIGAKVIVKNDGSFLPLHTVATIHSFVDENVNLDLGDERYCYYLRMDFHYFFGPYNIKATL